MELNGKFQYLSQNWSNPKIRGSICCGFSAAAQNWTTSVFLFCLCKCCFVTIEPVFVFCRWHCLCPLCLLSLTLSLSSLSSSFLRFFSCSTDLSSACLFLSHENALFPQNGSICRKRDRNIGIEQKILQGGQHYIGRLNLFWFDIIWDKPQWKTNIIICLWKCPNTSSMANIRRFYLDTSVQ